MSDTRLFYVTDSREDNEELHDTLEKAQGYALSALSDPLTARIRICEVRNAYAEGNGWNYDDLYDTFTTVKVVSERES